MWKFIHYTTVFKFFFKTHNLKTVVYSIHKTTHDYKY